MSSIPEAQTVEDRCDHRGNLFNSDLTNIKVSKDIAKLVRVYCIFNNRKVTEFVSEILERELKGFKEKIEKMKN